MNVFHRQRIDIGDGNLRNLRSDWGDLKFFSCTFKVPHTSEVYILTLSVKTISVAVMLKTH